LAISAMRTPGGGYWRAPFTLPAMFGRIDHVGLAVTDLEEAIDLHVNVYGLALVHRERVSEQGVEAALLDVGENHVELLAPLHEETPVGRFLAKRGPGLHHMAYQVDDIEAVLRTLRDAGLRLIDESPRIGIRRSQVAFLHPSASGGVLTEIVQPAPAEAGGEAPTRDRMHA
jgi:methylmalonyl-CoA/ethylmalonyl-CoA epimerase